MTQNLAPSLLADLVAIGDDTAIYDIRDVPTRARYVHRGDRKAARGRLIRATRQDLARLRDGLAAGWDIGPELAREERRLAALEAANRR